MLRLRVIQTRSHSRLGDRTLFKSVTTLVERIALSKQLKKMIELTLKSKDGFGILGLRWDIACGLRVTTETGAAARGDWLTDASSAFRQRSSAQPL